MIPPLANQRAQARTRLRETFGFLQVPHSTRSLKQLALQGTVWTLFGFGTSQFIRLAGNLILTRLLFPELFGLMALANIFVAALNLMSDFGIGASIIQNERGLEPTFVNTAWTLQVLRGAIVWLSSFALAIPFAQFYGDPRLQLVIPVVAFTAVLGGFNATSLYVLQRELNLRELTLLALVSQATGMIVILVWARLDPGVWAPVAGGIVGASVELIGSHRLKAGPRNQFEWDPSALKQLEQFGKWILLGTAVTFFAEQIDRLMLGKIISLELLGIYGIALAFAEVPRQVTLAISGQVLFPAISKLRDLPRRALREKILQNRRLVLFAFAAGLALFACFGDVLIRTLYDLRYWQAAWMLPLLAFGLWPRVLCNTIEPSLFAIGRPKYPALGQISRFVFTLFGILLGFTWFGIVGALAAVALNDAAYYLIINIGLWRQGLSGLKQDFQATALLAGFSALLLWGRALAGVPFHA
jgi:O-antigen/teichoic acid export membrane protein